MTTAEETGRIKELLKSARALGVEPRLRVVESLTRDLVLEGDDGLRFSCRSRAEYKRITKRKRWDAPLEEWIRSFVGSDVFYDIGANIGAFSLLAGKLHGEGIRVFSFEPGFDTFAALARNILVNELARIITPLQIALFDETGIRPFHYHALGAGSALHAVGDPIDYAGRPFTPVAVQPVLAFRLDDLVEQVGLPRPTRVKLDVDGVEPRVLAGAARTLAGGPCDVWVELTETVEGDTAPTLITSVLADLGFSLVRRVDHEKAPYTYPHLYDALFTRR